MRQVVLDTESTGLSHAAGHRLIEIGCVELYNRKLTGKTYQVYIDPKRTVDPSAMAVHGISTEFLQGKPQFKDILEDFLAFIGTCELIIHNAPFDVGFINHELNLAEHTCTQIETRCTILDTLAMARKRHSGQRNNLDALCKRYGVSNEHRTQHGALLDAEILAEVYLAMSAGQKQFALETESEPEIVHGQDFTVRKIKRNGESLKVIQASCEDLAKHDAFMRIIESSNSGV